VKALASTEVTEILHVFDKGEAHLC